MTLRFTMTRRIFSKVAWFQNHKLRIERVCLTWRAALSWCAARSIIEGSVKYKLKVLNYSFKSKNMWTSLCGKMWTPPFIFPTNIHNESGIILKWVINFSNIITNPNWLLYKIASEAISVLKATKKLERIKLGIFLAIQYPTSAKFRLTTIIVVGSNCKWKNG